MSLVASRCMSVMIDHYDLVFDGIADQHTPQL